MKYERLIAAAVATPWAIDRATLRVLQDVLTRRAAGERVDEKVVAEAVAKKKDRAALRVGDAALIPIYGVITQRADLFTEWSGGTSTEAVGRELDAAMDDPKAQAVVLDIDSPGGGVYGVPELGDKIHAAGKKKKIIGVVNSCCASGAFWLGSQATELVITPGGEIGSVGVYQLHVDESEAIAAGGRKVTILSAGERKTAGHPYGPLDEIGRAELQGGVDDYYEMFVRAVARGRGVAIKAVREGFGRGGMLRAEAAVKEGMADRIATIEQVLGRYGSSPETARRYSADFLRRRLMLDREAVVNDLDPN